MKNRMVVPAASALIFAAFVTLAVRLGAQTATQSEAGKPSVPANPAPHPAPAQPIPYSHKLHLSFSMQCKDCHTNPEPGNLMTFPATSRCMQCHQTIAKDKASIQKLAQYAKSQQPIPWVRVYTVLPGVNWSHRPHLAANVPCETCHGQVRDLDAMAEVTSVVTMYSCLHCHQQSQAKTACETCHKS